MTIVATMYRHEMLLRKMATTLLEADRISFSFPLSSPKIRTSTGFGQFRFRTKTYFVVLASSVENDVAFSFRVGLGAKISFHFRRWFRFRPKTQNPVTVDF